jgi:hypothetical protein
MVKHQASKSPGNTLAATEWNAEHVITSGLDSAKPSSGLAVGQLYWATDTQILYRATSSTSWEEMLRDDHASRHVDGGADEITSKLDFRAMNILTQRATYNVGFNTTSTTFVDVTGLSVTINPPYSANVLVCATLYQVRNTGGSSFIIQQCLVRDTTKIRIQLCVPEGDNQSVIALIQTLDPNISGNHTYKLQGCVVDGTSYWDMSSGAGYLGEIFAIAFKT